MARSRIGNANRKPRESGASCIPAGGKRQGFFAQALHQPLAATVFFGNSVHGP